MRNYSLQLIFVAILASCGRGNPQAGCTFGEACGDDRVEPQAGKQHIRGQRQKDRHLEFVRSFQAKNENNDVEALNRRLQGVCQETCIDFSHTGENAKLSHGDYVKDEWLHKYGMTVSAIANAGGYTPDGKLRIFDSTLYNTADPDLGSPNQECPGGGPGIGVAGGPQSLSANCESQGNLLIIQEADKDEPDDNAYGGVISFAFEHPGVHVSRLGFIDLDSTGNFLFLYQSTVPVPSVHAFGGLGDNSVQDEFIDQEDVTRLSIYVPASCGIREICFCAEHVRDLPSITSFTLVNADTNKDIETLADGASLVLSELPTINIRANTDGNVTGSVQFLIDDVPVGVEIAVPYALAGDSDGDYSAWSPRLGPQKLTAILYSDAHAKGSVLSSLSVSFTMTDVPAVIPSSSPSDALSLAPVPSPTRSPSLLPTQKPTPVPTVDVSAEPSAAPLVPTRLPTLLPTQEATLTPSGTPTHHPTENGMASAVTSFVLVDVDKNEDIGLLVDGTVLVLQNLPKINIRASTGSKVGSVLFLIDGVPARIEDVSPYALGGDSNGDYYSWEPVKMGPQTLEAIAFEKASAEGAILGRLSVSFTLDTSTIPAPNQTPQPSVAPPTVYPSPMPTPVPVQTTPRPTAGSPGPVLTGFTLVDAATNEDIEAILDGESLFLSDTTEINIRVNTVGKIGSIQFLIDEISIRVENTIPFSLAGDISGDYLQWDHAKFGRLTLKAVAYEEADASGAVLGMLSVTFRLFSVAHPTRGPSNPPSASPTFSGNKLPTSQPTNESPAVPSGAPTTAARPSPHPASDLSLAPSHSSPSLAPSTTPTDTPPTKAPAANDDDTRCPYKLVSWDDFKGPAPAGGNEDAVMASGIQYSPYDTEVPTKQLDGTWLVGMKAISGSAYMDKTMSGVKNGQETASLLEHEQYHFDISQYWARQLDKALKAVQGRGATPDSALDSIQKEVDRVYDDILKKMDRMQDEYDDATDHSRNTDKQKEWCKMIRNLLNLPAPQTPKASSASSYLFPSGKVEKDDDGNLTLSDLLLYSFFNASWFEDSYLEGAEVHLPMLSYEGLSMGDPSKPLFYPPNPTNAHVALFSPSHSSRPVLTGQLLALLGEGSTLRGWIENVEISQLGITHSPYLESMNNILFEGGGVLTLEIEVHGPTMPDYSSPFFAIGSIQIGVSDDGHATADLSSSPSLSPSIASSEPSVVPTVLESYFPTLSASATPTIPPSLLTASPHSFPTSAPVVVPTASPVVQPTSVPFVVPTVSPAAVPTPVPFVVPTVSPVAVPTTAPVKVPTASPIVVPTAAPFVVPTSSPVVVPTAVPFSFPTVISPSASPEAVATQSPDTVPTLSPEAAQAFSDDDRRTRYKQLTWDDFQGSPPNSTQAAYIFTGIQTSSYSISAPKLIDGLYEVKMRQITVISFMDKTQSGVKQDMKSDKLLQHEQVHFDITEHWARELERLLLRLVISGETQLDAFDKFQDRVNEVFGDLEQEWKEMQKAYDSETENGTLDSKQKEWNHRLVEWLNQ